MYDKAIEMLEKDDDGLLYLAYFNRGNTYLKLESYRSAVENYTKAIHILPEHGNSYINRAFAQYNLGKKDFACADWRKAHELGVPSAKGYIEDYCK